KAPDAPVATGADADVFVREHVLDPATAPWIGDHRPTYTRPALPLMSIADLLLQAAREAGRPGLALSGLEVQRWVVVDGPVRLRVEVEGDEARLLVWRDAARAALSRFEPVASARLVAPAPFSALPPLVAEDPAPLYADDRLFHGPAFHYGRRLTTGATGATGARLVLDAGAGSVPTGAVHPGLLDAATHAIPHDGLEAWSPRIAAGVVGYPRRLDLLVHAPLPTTGEVVAEARLEGFDDPDGEAPRFPRFRIELRAGGTLLAELRLTEVLLPKGPLGEAPPAARRRFLEGRPAAGVSLARIGDTSVLDPADVARSSWFPHAMADVYGDGEPRVIAAKEHVAAQLGVHPREVAVEGRVARVARLPFTRFDLEVDAGRQVRVSSREVLDRARVEAYWSRHFGLGHWPVEDLYYGLVERFVGRVTLEDPEAIAALRGRPALFLANHQTGIESLLFSILAGALLEVPALTLAKAEHRESWLGRLIAHCFTWPGAKDPGVITFFDRSDPTSLPRIAGELAGQAGARSLMVHV
ncbi:MAG: 3-hydroxyacyl-[acyl-carrier-protein] dehydratase FabA, partial [Myxococcota bacterium]